MTWLPETAAGRTNLDRVLGVLPDVRGRHQAVMAALWDPDVLGPVVLELCRLRIGTLLGSAGEAALRYADARAAGLDEVKIAALPSYPSSPLFTETERRCLAFAEQYVLDPHGIGDGDFDGLRAVLSPAQLATLVLAVAMFEATTRMRLALGIEPEGDGPVLLAGPRGCAPEKA
jgi:alkylhydroperoxidase family enzyme